MGSCFGNEGKTKLTNNKTAFSKRTANYNTTKYSVDADYNYLFKFLVIGDTNVGKSSLLLRFTDNTFTETFVSTIGVDFKIRTITMEDGERVKLQLWDTAGQERFRSITPAFYRGAHGFIVVYDVTNRQSFLNIRRWITDSARYAPANAPKILVGNKCDLSEERQVTTEEAEALAKELELEFIETSAKVSVNVDDVFNNMSTLVRANHLKAANLDNVDD